MDSAALDSLSQRVALAAHCDLGSGITVAPDGRVVGRFLQTRLTSVFEPLFALADGSVRGAQAGVRTVGSHGPGLAPWEVFAAAARPQDLVELDRLARTVHAISFEALAQPGQALHLSVHPRLLDAVTEHHGQVYRGLLETLGLDGLPVVIELPAITPGDEDRIAPVAASYRRNGFGVAFRPVSRRQLEVLLASNSIDALRIDADRLVRFGAVDGALRAARKRRIDVIVERVRSAFDVELARELGATHVQGLLFGAPVAAPDMTTPLSGRAGAVASQVDRLDVRQFLLQGA
jgi:EAL domain-containing protein (putative c-di-GMP-specific phosphodiesterase class I)